MKDQKDVRFNAEYLKSIFDSLDISIREVARRVGVSHPSVLAWLSGTVPTKANLKKLIEVLEEELDTEVDPNAFLADPFDLLYSEAMTFAYKIFRMERAGVYEVKISLASIVRLLEALEVFKEPPIDLSALPESALQQSLPYLEEQAKAQAQLHIESLVAENKKDFLRVLVEEHKDAIEEILDEASER